MASITSIKGKFKLNVVLGCVAGVLIGVVVGTLLPDDLMAWPALIPGVPLLLWVLIQLRKV